MPKGIAASSGYAVGKAYLMVKKEIVIDQTPSSAPEEEIKTLEDAMTTASSQLTSLYEKAKKDVGEEEATVFESHKMMLEDPEFIGQIKNNIEQEKLRAPYAIQKAKDFFVGLFESMDNEYMQARASDIKDISDRLIRLSLGESLDGEELPDQAIVIAEDLTPSDTAQLDKNKVQAFVTEVGSKTSHSAIMARSMGIPAVLGVQGILDAVKENDVLAVDGFSGDILINPSEDVVETYVQKRKDYEAELEALNKYKNVSLAYANGRKIQVAGNIGSVNDLKLLVEQGAQGVGLFRTEFLFMGRDAMPSEEEQFEAYKEVAETMKGHSVVIRTLDIGGDKVIPYMDMPKEDNPFLGLRAVRLCFKEIDIFKTQLRALLRAAVYGNIHIMFPMIGAMEELQKAKSILEECKNDLRAQGVEFKEDVPVGMMIEIPAAAVAAPEFAKEVDFFSIGTNDLVQYTLAVDRMNTNIAHLYNPLNPSVLRLIKMTIDAAHAEGIWCGMCGEMASDPVATKILAEYELDEFSVTGSAVLQTKGRLAEIDKVTEL